jgi:hypothetical protein
MPVRGSSRTVTISLEGAATAMMMIMRIPLKTAPSGDDDDAR